jgi:hypothetical protein
VRSSLAVSESLSKGLLLHALAPIARTGLVGALDGPPEECHDSCSVLCLTGLAGACWTRLLGLRGRARGAMDGC